MMETITTSRWGVGGFQAISGKSRVSDPALILEIPGITENHGASSGFFRPS